MNEPLRDPSQLDELISARCAILENLKVARDIVNSTHESSRAEAYWIPHIWGAVEKETEWVGGSMICMDETIKDLLTDDLVEYLREKRYAFDWTIPYAESIHEFMMQIVDEYEFSEEDEAE